MTTELQLPKFHGRFSDGSEVLDALAELFDGLVFYRDEEYYHLSEWVILVSEALDPKFVDYSPVGVKWYYPRYALYSPFPFTDLSRPAGFFDCTSCTASSSYDTVCNTGTCNNETGLCDCLYNATGYYCEKEPFGNGVCDDFLNHNRFYDYQFWFDGGDCCAPTCSLPHCGQGRLDTLFGVDLSEANLTYMSANTSASDWIGYQKCRDLRNDYVLNGINPRIQCDSGLCASFYGPMRGSRSRRIRPIGIEPTYAQ